MDHMTGVKDGYKPTALKQVYGKLATKCERCCVVFPTQAIAH